MKPSTAIRRKVMKTKNVGQKTARLLTVLVGLASLLMWIPDADAASKRAKRSKSVPSKVARAPVCNNYQHPKILKVTPDEVKPGQKITIKGENFGSKRCFQQVSFGRAKTKRFKYVNDTTITATVPRLRPGLTKVNILTAGGASQYVVLIEKSKSKSKSRSKRKRKR